MQAPRVRGVPAIGVFLLFTVVGVAPIWADIDNDRYESSKPWYVGISGPANWRMNEQASYASTCIKAGSSSEGGADECQRSDQRYTYSSILLWMHRRSPAGKMLLAAEKLEQQMTSFEYATRTRELLGKLGFQVRIPQLHAATGAYWLEFDNGKRFLRQAVLVSGRIGYSLTLSASSSRDRASHLRAFDFALRSIGIDRDKTSGDQDTSEKGSPEGPENGDKDRDKGSARDDKKAGSANPDKNADDRASDDKAGSKADRPRKETP